MSDLPQADVGAQAIALLALIRQDGRLRDHLLGQWRCPAGCRLVTAFTFGGRRLLVAEGFKESPARAARANDVARARNTTDGTGEARRWRARGFDLEDFAGWQEGGAQIDVHCHHGTRLLPGDVLAQAAEASPRRPLHGVLS